MGSCFRSGPKGEKQHVFCGDQRYRKSPGKALSNLCILSFSGLSRKFRNFKYFRIRPAFNFLLHRLWRVSINHKSGAAKQQQRSLHTCLWTHCSGWRKTLVSTGQPHQDLSAETTSSVSYVATQNWRALGGKCARSLESGHTPTSPSKRKIDHCLEWVGTGWKGEVSMHFPSLMPAYHLRGGRVSSVLTDTSITQRQCSRKHISVGLQQRPETWATQGHRN